MKHYIVYSHGFGVKKDDRGLFTDIAASMPEYEHILFDYNQSNDADNTLVVSPLQEQARRLLEKLAELDDGQNKIIDIVAHSQGCVVVALARPANVRRILCLTPPDNLSVESMVKTFGSRPGSIINLDGESRVSRRDGSVTIIPKPYWQSIGLNVQKLYNYLPERSDVKFYIANDDEVLGATDFDQTDKRIALIPVDGNHDFTGKARQDLIKTLKEGLH